MIAAVPLIEKLFGRRPLTALRKSHAGPFRQKRALREIEPSVADARLVSRARRGHQAAYGKLYDKAAPRLYSLLVQMLRDEAEARLLFVSIFDEIWDRLSDFDFTRSTFAAWSVSIARKRAIDRLRETGRLQNHPLALEIRERWQRSSGVGSEKDVLELALYCGMTLPEISAWLDLPVPQVKRNLASALLADS